MLVQVVSKALPRSPLAVLSSKGTACDHPIPVARTPNRRFLGGGYMWMTNLTLSQSSALAVRTCLQSIVIDVSVLSLLFHYLTAIPQRVNSSQIPF